jgi:hypothetical protein
MVDHLDQVTIARAFRDALVPQNPNDESPACYGSGSTRRGLNARDVRRFYLARLLSAQRQSDGRSGLQWRVFGRGRRLEKARGGRGLSSLKPLIVVRRKV